jgi:hypothetical protein
MSKTMKDKRAEAEAALRQPLRADDPNLEVVDRQPRAKTVLSVRMDPDLARRLSTEADRRSISPSELMRELIESGLHDTEHAGVVNLADAHRALNKLAHHRKSA